MHKKSPSGSAGTSAPDYGVSVPCFPSPVFSSQSHLRHVLPQIPTRASHPRMAVSKASTRDPFIGRTSEGEPFADVITTHRLDDSLEQTHVVTKELHDDLKFYDRNRPENHKQASGAGMKHTSREPCVGSTLAEFAAQSSTKGRNISLWEDDDSDDDTYFSLGRSTSPSSMLNIGETTKKRAAEHRSPPAGEFAKLGPKASHELSTAVGDSNSGFTTHSSKSSKRSKLGATVLESVLNPRSRYPTKTRDDSKSLLFRMSDEDDSDDAGSSDSPVAMNLSLATKSHVQTSSNTESLPKFPAPQQPTVSRGRFTIGSPLDAIMKMTSMITTSKNEPPSFTANTAVASGNFSARFSATFQPVADTWSQDARVFGSASLPGMSYGKIAAEGVAKIPAQSSDLFDDLCTSQSRDTAWDSSTQLQSAKQALSRNLGEAPEDSANIHISEGSPIKLKIRRGAKGDNSELSIVTSKRMKDTDADNAVMKSVDVPAVSNYSSLALPPVGAAPSPGTAPTGIAKSKLAAPGRAKTKGELKKQLFERKEQRLRTDGSQASSPAGSTMTPSPPRSHTDTLSPLSVNVDGGGSTPQPSPLLNSAKTGVAAAVNSPTETVSVTSFCSVCA